MILDTMTPAEMSRYLEPVRERISQYAASMAKRVGRKAKKNTWFRVGLKHITYQDEVFYFFTRAQHYRKNGFDGFDITCVPYCMITRNDGSRYILQFELCYPKVLRTYEMHLFKRYQERFLKESLDLWTVIHRFFENNYAPGMISKGKSGYGTIINDGVVLSNEVLNVMDPIVVYRYKTFITQQMLYDNQDSWNRDGAYKDLLEEVLNLFHTGGPEYIQHADYRLNIDVESIQKNSLPNV